MDLGEFDQRLKAAKAGKPSWFMAAGEAACSNTEISSLETALSVRLPDQYKQYVAAYGGGYIGQINVFSAHHGSDWYLLTCNRFVPPNLGFVAITDDQTGGYYGFVVNAGRCSDAVYYWHHEDGRDPVKEADSFFEYVVSVGLSW